MAVAPATVSIPQPPLTAAAAATAIAVDPNADLVVPVSTGADILKRQNSGLWTGATNASANVKSSTKSSCPIANAAAAMIAAVSLGPANCALSKTGADTPSSTKHGVAMAAACIKNLSACSSLTSMPSVDPPMIIAPVLTKSIPAAESKADAGSVKPAVEADAGAVAASDAKKLTLQELVHAISAELNAGKDMKRVRSLMERYDSSLGEWKRYAFYDAKTNYTRNLIATDQKTFTLMQLCWNPSKWSPCHDHNGSECFMRMVDGSLVEVRYAWPASDDAKAQSQPLKVLSQTTLSPGSVCFINDSLGLHKVGNPSTSVPAVSLHCYIPGYDTCRAWCKPDESARCIEANITYYSEGGKKACH